MTDVRPNPDNRAETLIASYERTGYGRVDPAILQPAEPVSYTHLTLPTNREV